MSKWWVWLTLRWWAYLLWPRHRDPYGVIQGRASWRTVIGCRLRGHNDYGVIHGPMGTAVLHCSNCGDWTPITPDPRRSP